MKEFRFKGKLSDLFCKLTNIRLIELGVLKSTVMLQYANFNTREFRSSYIQFSLKDPWLIPHHEDHYGKIDIPLSGWLFFYFGAKTEGFIYQHGNEGGLKDKDGNPYYVKSFDSQDAIDYHKKIVRGSRFKDHIETNEDGTYDVHLVEL